MARRYVGGLAIAACVFVILFALAALPDELHWHSTGDALASVLPVAGGLGVMNVALLAIGVGPMIARISSRSRRRGPCAILGAAHGLVYVGASAVMFAEREDTLVATLDFWRRVPGELLIHLLPGAVSGLAFALWLTSRRPSPLARASPWVVP